MARHTPLTSLKQLSEINLTPLMDLTFILLITFIITFPLIEQGIPVNLPKGESSELAPEESRTITIDGDGMLYLDNVGISREALSARLTELIRFSPRLTVLVRGDESIPYGQVVEVLKVLHAAGITRMALVTQPD
jgi:biopolymer transport protein TolR